MAYAKDTTRGVKLRLVLPRDLSRETKELHRALGTTASEYNKAVAHWQRVLLELRQDEVNLDDDEIVGAGEWRRGLVERFGRPLSSTEFEDLQSFYKLLVPSYVVKNAGAAKDATGLMLPMLSASSSGGEKRFDVVKFFGWLPDLCMPADEAKKIKRKTKSKEDIPRVPEEVRERIERYIEDHPRSATPTGQQPKWVVRRKKELRTKPKVITWHETLLEEVERKVDIWDSWSVVPRLRDRGLRPITKAYFKIEGVKTPSNQWDYSALEVAAAGISAWESKRHERMEERAKIKAKIEKALEAGKHFLGAAADLRAMVSDLTVRTTRGWSTIDKWLHKNPNVSEEGRKRFVRNFQAKDPKKVGDGALLQELVSDRLIHLTRHPEGDVVSWSAEQNGLEFKLENIKTHPAFSFARGSRPVSFDSIANTNKPQYSLRLKGRQLYASIPLLFPASGVEWRVESREFKVATSGQLRGLSLGTKKKSQTVRRISQDKLDVIESIAAGGSLIVKSDPKAYLTVALKTDIDVDAVKRRGAARSYLSSALPNRKKKKEAPVGAKVLAVDLGMRHAAACSVYTVAPDSPTHEKSFILRLPGDKPSPEEIDRRARAFGEIKRAASAVRAASEALKAARKDELDIVSFYEAERAAEKAIAELRQSQRKQRIAHRRSGKSGGWGLSLAYIDYLDMTRRLLASWANRDRPGKDPKRGSKKGVAKGLLEHMRNVKKDRAKKTADLIVQAARGRMYRNGAWVKAFDEVDVIVVDGLQLYRSWKGRSPTENKRLMQWCHRAVSQNTELQAQEASIAVTETRVAYTSEFHATSRAPGMRCRFLTQRDIDSLRPESWLWKRLVEDMGIAPEDVGLVRAEDLIPQTGGGIFATLDAEEHLVALNADVNAAQNTAIWYIEGHSRPVRISALKMKEGPLAVDCSKPRLFGAFEAKGMTLKEREPNQYSEDQRFRTLASMAVALGVLDPTELQVSDHDSEETESPFRHKKGNTSLFRDLSGVFFCIDRWVERKTFWDSVRGKIIEALADRIRSRRERF